MSTCNFTQVIQQQECIGDSLVKINNNFGSLDDNLCNTISNIQSLSANLNASLSAVQAATAFAVPIGTVIAHVQTTAPTGWLICNGVTVPNGVGTVQGQTANFSSLFSVLDDGVIPDLRGVFIRGLDQGRGQDPGRSHKSYQVDALQNIYGQFRLGGTENINVVNGAFANFGSGGGPGGGHNGGTPWNPLVDFNAARVARVAGETRPRNVALVYCIKY